jgi:hypothetical protein
VIGLIDLSSQLIKWAAWVHWITEKYTIVRAWLFGWLPWRIPPEWHDPIVLFLFIFSVANAGVYHETNRSFLFHFFRKLWLPVAATSMAFVLWVLPRLLTGAEDISTASYLVFQLFGGLVFAFLMAAWIAWRWPLATAAIFGALVAINYAYVQWLGPLAEHH